MAALRGATTILRAPARRRILCRSRRHISATTARSFAADSGTTREEKLLAYHDSKVRTVDDLLALRVKDATNQYSEAPYFSVDRDASVLDAVRTMVDRDVGSLWVEEQGGAPAGIVTERDYLRKVVVRGKESVDTAVSEIMTPFAQVVAVTPAATILECLQIMNEKQFRHLPVVSSADPGAAQVVAMISMKDLIKQFTRYHEAQVRYLQEYIPFEVW